MHQQPQRLPALAAAAAMAAWRRSAALAAPTMCSSSSSSSSSSSWIMQAVCCCSSSSSSSRGLTLAAAAAAALPGREQQQRQRLRQLHTSAAGSAAVALADQRQAEAVADAALATRREQLRAALTPSPADAAAVPRAAAGGDRRLLDAGQRRALALLRRFNVSQPGLRGQVILARVLRATPRQLLVDPGYYGTAWVALADLAGAAAHDADGRPKPPRRPSMVAADVAAAAAAAAGGEAAAAEAAAAEAPSSPSAPAAAAAANASAQAPHHQLQAGDYVRVRLSALATPYGDAQLDAVGVPADVRRKLVWQELQRRMVRGEPVRGRLLNVVRDGYAVGVAGYVALLRHGQATPEAARRIGALQDFFVHRMDAARRTIELSSAQQRRRGDMRELYARSL